MQPDYLKYTLTNVTDSTSLVLDHAPDGWDDTLAQMARNMKYTGVFRQFSVPMRFVSEGFEYLREAYYNYGIEADVSLVVETLNLTDWTYDEWFTGKLDFSKYNEQGRYVEINVLDRSFAAIVKAREDQVYDVSCEVGVSAGAFEWYRYYWDSRAMACRGLKYIISDILDLMTEGGITAGTYGFSSSLLDSMPYIVLTTGRHIRQCPSPISVSFSDIFKALDAMIGVGVGIEMVAGVETLVLEEKAHFFDTGIDIIELSGKVSNLKIYPDLDKQYSSIKIGYKKQTIEDDTFQKNETNGTTEWMLPFLRVKKELELICPFRSDYSGIEDIVTTYGTDPAKWESPDSDVFILELAEFDTPPMRYILYWGSIKKTSTGVITGWYNMRYSPRHMVENQLSYIHSLCWPLDGYPAAKYIIYISSDFENWDNETTSYPDVGYYSEHGNILIDSAVTKLFLPIIFEFEAASSNQLTLQELANYNGLITFQAEDLAGNAVEMKGFVLEIGAHPVKSKAMTFKLLAAPDTDLSLLQNKTLVL